MDYDKQLKLQAFLDEELSEGEAREVASWLAQDQEATLLLAEMRNTRQALSRFEAGVRLPESREFYWSKIERELDRLESRPVSAEQKVSWLAAWRRFLIPASAVAGLVIAALLTIGPPQGQGPEAESSYNDPGAFTYRDYDNHATLIWLSYPAENDLADAEPLAKFL